MSSTSENSTRIIQINNGIIGPIDPKSISVTPKRLCDYPGIPAVYLDVAKNYSSARLL